MSSILKIINAGDLIHRARGNANRENIQLVCKGTVERPAWFQPKWGPEGSDKTADLEIYIANNDHLYTFNPAKVTCSGCKNL